MSKHDSDMYVFAPSVRFLDPAVATNANATCSISEGSQRLYPNGIQSFFMPRLGSWISDNMVDLAADAMALPSNPRIRGARQGQWRLCEEARIARRGKLGAEDVY